MTMTMSAEVLTAELTIGELEAEICGMAGRLAAETYRWLVLIAEFDRRGGWSGFGVRSSAHWLAWTCSMSAAAAREHVRIARCLVDLPLISAAFAAGTLSYSKVRALTRVASQTDEATLLALAEWETASQLERTVRGFRKTNGSGLDQQRRRRVRAYFDEDGMFVLSARLTAEEGAVLMAALAAAESTIDVPADPEERLREDREADRLDIDPRALSTADAFMVVARTALNAGPADLSGEDRTLVVLHLDSVGMTSPDVGGLEEGLDVVRRIDRGPGVDRATSERLSCDATITALITDASQGTLNVGRQTRKINLRLRRALMSRDGCCRFPACHRRTHLEAHHIVPWSEGGPTDLDNLVLLCRFHHMTLHEAGFGLQVSAAVGDRTTLVFSRPDGVPIPQAPPLHPGATRDIVDIPSDRIRPKQTGERFCLPDAVGALCA